MADTHKGSSWQRTLFGSKETYQVVDPTVQRRKRDEKEEIFPALSSKNVVGAVQLSLSRIERSGESRQ